VLDGGNVEQAILKYGKGQTSTDIPYSYFEAIRVLLSKGWKPKRTVHMSFVAGKIMTSAGSRIDGFISCF
jgi:hypothetical protein